MTVRKIDRKIDQVISDLEDVNTSLQEVQDGLSDPSALTAAQETLDQVTDDLEAIADEDEDSKS